MIIYYIKPQFCNLFPNPINDSFVHKVMIYNQLSYLIDM